MARTLKGKKVVRVYKSVTVRWRQYFAYCVHCSHIYLDMRDTCNCGGLRRRTHINSRVLTVEDVPEPIGLFMVRFQEAEILNGK